MSRYTPRAKFAPPEAVHGHGEQSVYVYFAETERRLAGLERRNGWPCKVGSTIGSVERRILAQGIKGSMARMPIIGLILRCGDAHQLERKLHKALRRDGCWIREAPCAEWFNTKPDVVLHLARQLVPEAFAIPEAPRQEWAPPPGRGRRISCNFEWRSPGVMLVLTAMSPLEKLAQPLGITVSAISQWARVPLKRVADVERITGIARAVLRPDLFGEEEGNGGDQQVV